ncbi:putative NAD binding Rossmann fold oxidoreductase [Infundibulicybe gibba]|nr:putative NAD binding Rossmann fold oxidoreductase [Infundibulicybe gibba]
MALALQALTFVQQYTSSYFHPVAKKTEHPLKVGVISSAQINAAAIIHPTETHPDVVLYAIASRDLAVAQSAARKYRFQKSYGSYEELVDDPEVDFIYISCPNSLHYEWAFRSLDAGKHVLLEKPFASNSAEAVKLTQKAKEKGKFREILESGEHGKIVRTDAWMTSTPEIPAGDIRWKFELSGGSLMDMTYALSFTRFALNAGAPEEVLSAKARLASHDPAKGYDVHSTIYTDMQRRWLCGVIPRFWELPAIQVETDKSTIYFYNAMMPHLYHYIAITDKATGHTKYEKCYSGGPKWGDGRGEAYWSTYRYQLEAFVDMIRGKEPAHWVTNEESILQMKSIDAVYQKSGLPLRPTSVLAI